MDIQKLVFLLLFSLLMPVFGAAPRLSAPKITPTITDSVAHPTDHFTQGLFFDGNDLIETTGLYGKSGLYRRTLQGQVLDSFKLDSRYFGEGSISIGDEVYYLTWKDRKGFIFNRKPFKLKQEFPIPTEGWGLTVWRGALLMSNGSHQLLQISPRTFEVLGIINVRDKNSDIPMLNELEILGDTLYANLWQSDWIAVIDLPSGNVIRYLDFSKKTKELRKKYPDMDVLNGIAFDGHDMWVTGKNWPYIYKIKDFR